MEDDKDPDLLFSVYWHRIVLDEGEIIIHHFIACLTSLAHTIQNSGSHLAQSCYALRSSNRWAITGTPIQNKLTDFASLVRFLQVYPYSEHDNFDEDIFRPWRRGDSDGFLRLKTLVRAITISRTKKVVHLPSREDFIYHLDFSPEELDLYDDAKKQTIPLIRNALSSHQGAKPSNALQHLNNLRLICSHGRLAQCFRGLESAQIENQPTSCAEINIQDSFLDQVLSGNSTCNSCGKELLEDLLEGSSSARTAMQLSSTPEVCEQCIFQMTQSSFGQWPRGDLLEAPCTPVTQSPTPSAEEDSAFAPPIESMPTKIKALVADLAEHSPLEKR